MQYTLNFKCSDNFGSWPSNSCNFFDSDKDAMTWAKEELSYLRKRFDDITFSEVVLVENDLSPMFERGDRFITKFD